MHCHNCQKEITPKIYKDYWGLCKPCSRSEDRVHWTSATLISPKEFSELPLQSMVAVFDTECTGLPPKTFYSNAFRFITDIPRILSVGMVKFRLGEEKESEAETHHYWLVKPDGYKNSPEAEKVNKLTPEILETGQPLARVIEEILEALRDVDVICAHNVSYDYTVLASELYRLSMKEALRNLYTKKFFNTQAGYRVSLSNMYRLTIGQDPEEELHNALADATICAAVARQLYRVKWGDDSSGETCSQCGKSYPEWWFRSNHCLFLGCNSPARIIKRFSTPKPRINLPSLCSLLASKISRPQFLAEWLNDNEFALPAVSHCPSLGVMFKIIQTFQTLCHVNLWTNYYQLKKVKELHPAIKFRMEPTYWKLSDDIGHIYDAVLHDGESIYYYGNHLPPAQKFRMELLCYFTGTASYKLVHLDGGIEVISIMPNIGLYRTLGLIAPLQKMMSLEVEALDEFLFEY